MAGLVVDASVTLAWALAELSRAAEAEHVLELVVDHGAIVPTIWRLEVGNTVILGERRGRLSERQVMDIWDRLDRLPITADPETDAHAWGGSAALARRHGLTLYDATYLELAVRRRLPLATFDRALAAAAAVERVSVLPPAS